MPDDKHMMHFEKQLEHIKECITEIQRVIKAPISLGYIDIDEDLVNLHK